MGEIGKAKETINANDETIKDLEDKLALFKDADVTGLKELIAVLETEKGNIKKNYRQQLEDRDFDNIDKIISYQAITRNNNQTLRQVYISRCAARYVSQTSEV